MGWLFRNAGYETAYGGKTHVPGKITRLWVRRAHRGTSARGLAAACAAFLQQAHDKPFLLVASFINPHDICYMAIDDFERARPASRSSRAKLRRRYARRRAGTPGRGVARRVLRANTVRPLPANLEPQADAPEAVQQALGGKARTFRQHAFRNWSDEQWRLHRWAYCRLTERVDAQIGQVLEALRAAGLEEKTLVVFTSDHGDMDGSHRLEHKSMFYEEAARVPFIVSYKGVTKPGLVDNQHLVSSGQDLIPTLCDYAGIKPPAALLGPQRAGVGRGPRGRRLAAVRRVGDTLRADDLFWPIQVLCL